MKEHAVYRLRRARETFEEALVLANTEHWPGCTNRLYYACFYVVWALLLANGLTTKKHSGVRSLFNKNFIKNGRLNTDFGDLYSDLYESRMENDYEAENIEPGRVRAWLEQVPVFLNEVEMLALQTLNQSTDDKQES